MLNVNIWNIAFTIINLLVLYCFMKHFLFGPVHKILEERKSMIEEELNQTTQAKAEAEKIKLEYEASMEQAEEEASKLIADATFKAKETYDKILQQARTDSALQLKEAERTIALEREQIMGELRTGVAGLAMTAAAKILKEQYKPQSDQNLYNRFLVESGEGND